MQIALDGQGQRIYPFKSPGDELAICPGCKSRVWAKCGEINAHHWAHLSKADCDNFAEGETAWHARWKAVAPLERREVVIGKHRADIQLASGTVVELQRSYLSPTDIREREAFYGPNMIWLIAGAAFSDRFHIFNKFNHSTKRTFLWLSCRKSVALITRPLLIDFGEEAVHCGEIPGTLFQVRKFHAPGKHGWGEFVARESFKGEIRNG